MKRIPVLLLFLAAMLCTVPARADTEISADKLEFDGQSSTYRAEGAVSVRRGEAELKADSVIFNEKSSMALAEGGVTYEDPDVSITAESAELNLETRLGTMNKAKLFIKRGGYRIRAEAVQRTGASEFLLKNASLTTCDAPVPAWCLKGSDIRLRLGNMLTAKDVTFSIKGVPVFYSPVLSIPVLTGRSTGLLVPTVGLSGIRGVSIEQPFFWAVSEEADATVTAEYYSKRGAGGSVEYRRLAPGGISAYLFGRYLHDNEINEDFLEMRTQYYHKRSVQRPVLNALLDLNYVNKPGFYQIYEPFLEDRAERFLESNAEISLPLTRSRLYMRARDIIDLKEDGNGLPQTLPSVGAEIYPTPLGPVARLLGPVAFALSAEAANFTRKEGAEGTRASVSPSVRHSFGRALTVYQSAAVRKTYYSFKDAEDAETDIFEYELSARTALTRSFGSVRHVIEPTVSYLYRAVSGDEPVALFDSLEMKGERRAVVLSLMNRLINTHGELLTFRVSQTIDEKNTDLFTADLNLRRPVSFRASLSYDSSAEKVESLASKLSLALGPLGLSAGQRYRRGTDVDLYTLGFSFPGRTSAGALSLQGRLWYDKDTDEFTDVTASLKLVRQCWGLRLSVVRKPEDTSVFFKIDLLGLSTLSI